jgi:hypothetical protein
MAAPFAELGFGRIDLLASRAIRASGNYFFHIHARVLAREIMIESVLKRMNMHRGAGVFD